MRYSLYGTLKAKPSSAGVQRAHCAPKCKPTPPRYKARGKIIKTIEKIDLTEYDNTAQEILKTTSDPVSGSQCLPPVVLSIMFVPVCAVPLVCSPPYGDYFWPPQFRQYAAHDRRFIRQKYSGPNQPGIGPTPRINGSPGPELQC